MDPSDTLLRKHAETAEFEARKAERPDYYALLGCGRTAGPSDVKSARGVPRFLSFSSLLVC